MPPGRGSEVLAGTLTGGALTEERWPAVQADNAATQTAAAATAMTARMLIRPTTAHPGCVGVVRYGAAPLYETGQI